MGTGRYQHQMQTYEIMMFLTAVAIFCVVHIIFKNIRDIFIWSCKIITTVFLWSLVWVATQLHHLPDWKTQFTESVWQLVNMTKGEL